jgi:hypothetical protein
MTSISPETRTMYASLPNGSPDKNAGRAHASLSECEQGMVSFPLHVGKCDGGAKSKIEPCIGNGRRRPCHNRGFGRLVGSDVGNLYLTKKRNQKPSPPTDGGHRFRPKNSRIFRSFFHDPKTVPRNDSGRHWAFLLGEYPPPPT